MTQSLATRFHDLHAEGLLLLSNAWDVGSARIACSTGARAVATSSAAVAWTHGWPDGDALPVELLLQTVRAVASAVDIPLTVDIEGGYSDDPVRVGELVARVVAAGAVGINIEDGVGEPALLCAKVAAARAAANAADVHLFINARTDVFLRGLVPARQQAAEVARREALYREAGASGIFAPGIVEDADIATVVAAVSLPLNVLARPEIDPSKLEAFGVRRYSAGSAISEAVLGLAEAMMREFNASGRLNTRGVAPMPYAGLNKVMARA